MEHKTPEYQALLSLCSQYSVSVYDGESLASSVTLKSRMGDLLVTIALEKLKNKEEVLLKDACRVADLVDIKRLPKRKLNMLTQDEAKVLLKQAVPPWDMDKMARLEQIADGFLYEDDDKNIHDLSNEDRKNSDEGNDQSDEDGNDQSDEDGNDQSDEDGKNSDDVN
jgi:hypothetical protein